MPVMPHIDAGWRIDPPVSVPVAAGASRAATRAAEPPDVPPGMAWRSHGFLTGPKYECSFDEPIANSSQLALPSVTTPCAARRSTTVASNGLTYCSSMCEPAVERKSRVVKMSLCAIGMPVRGAASPAAMRASAAFACASDTSARTSMNAFRSPCAAMRARYRRVSSTLETLRSRNASPSARTVDSCMVRGLAGQADAGRHSITFGTR